MSRLLLILLCLTSPVMALDLSPLRVQFLAAEQALKLGQHELYKGLRQGLDDYPLTPYLDYQQLGQRLTLKDRDRVASFLERNVGTPLADRLRTRWLNLLGKHQAWRDYLAFYEPQESVTRQCYYLRALLATGESEQAFTQVPDVWRHGKSLPDTCDPVLDAWRQAGRLTQALVWERIALAMRANQVGLARYVGRYLSAREAVWLERWLKIHADPRQSTKLRREFAKPHPYREIMLAHAVRRLGRKSGLEGAKLWRTLRQRYEFPAELQTQVNLTLALNLFRDDDPAAYAFIAAIEPEFADDQVHETRIRAALLRLDWPNVERWIGQMPEDERAKPRWQYWLGRAKQQQNLSPKSHWARAAEDRGYYGYLAADRLGLPYNLHHAETPIEAALQARIAALPAALRAHELYRIDDLLDARREWQHLTRTMNKQELMAAAKLAQSWGWLSQAIFTLARSGYWDDLELRFPLRHKEIIEHQADRVELPASWVFAIVRQESAFMPDAQSGAGAMGPMQLMPATARLVARKNGDKKPRRKDLFKPETNIRLGASYLRQMLDRFDGQQALSAAAYNAGPHRVKQWRPEQKLPADVWIDLIPFKETRSYVRRVLAYQILYEHRLGQEPGSIQRRLPAVQPRNG